MSLIDLNGNTLNRGAGKTQNPLSGIVKCQNPQCKCLFFQQAYMLKKITQLEKPQLQQDSLGVIPVFICMECGTVLNQTKL